jgi:hypothetical protein
LNTCIGFIVVHTGLFSIKELFSRRTIMIVGAIACSLYELASGVASSFEPNSKATGNVLETFMALFKFCYNASVGVATNPLATELVNSRLQAWTVGSANALRYFPSPGSSGSALRISSTLKDLN